MGYFKTLDADAKDAFAIMEPFIDLDNAFCPCCGDIIVQDHECK